MCYQRIEIFVSNTIHTASGKWNVYAGFLLASWDSRNLIFILSLYFWVHILVVKWDMMYTLDVLKFMQLKNFGTSMSSILLNISDQRAKITQKLGLKDPKNSHIFSQPEKYKR